MKTNFDAEESLSTASSDVFGHEKTRWNSFQKTLGGMWLTKQILPKDADKHSIVKTTLRELLVYITFLATITYITFSMMNPTMYYQTKILSELFLDKPFQDANFRTASQMNHFWQFVEGPLIDGLYWNKWYNNESTSNERSILYENYLLGSPKIRQLRVRNDSCQVHEDFSRAIHTCFNSYADFYEDKSDLHGGSGDGFKWTEINAFAKNEVWGKIGTYSGEGGFIVDLTLNKSIAKDKIQFLKSNLWLDRGSRVVFIDFTTYNPNINLFVVSKLISEFPATGGMITSWQFRTLNLLESSFSLILAFSSFVFFILYYSIEEMIEIKTLGFFTYMRDSYWNILDILTILISVLLCFFTVYRRSIINQIFSGTFDVIETYQFDNLGFWCQQFSNVLAVLAFISWIKLFKYISFNKTMSQLSSTLSRCAKDIAGFGLMFFIVFFAFAQLGYLLFGTQVKDYSSFGSAVFTLLRLILGDFNFYDLEAANRVLGPIYFLTYIFFVFFVLMNMFLAIINDTYAEVKSEITNDDEFAVMDYFKDSYNNFMFKLGKQKDQIEGIQQAIKVMDTKNDGAKKLSFDEVRIELKKKNLSDQEIEMLFARYDVDSNRELDEHELKAMFNDLEGKKKQIELEIKQNVNRPETAHRERTEQASKLTKRVDRMEYTLSVISSKIDAVLQGKLVTENQQQQE